MTELRPIRLDAELPYGMAEDGRLVRVEDVPRGLACHCRCPQCDRRLIARQGDVLRWHFAHEAEGVTCVGAFETMVHWLAKQIIADAGRIKVPPLIGYFEGTARRVVEPMREIAIADVKIEASLVGIRPDILACHEDGTALAIEVWVAHRTNPDKISRLRERQLATMEIDLSGFRTGLLSANIFAEAVLRSPARTWLWHPRQAKADAIIAAEVEADRAAVRAVMEHREALRQEAEARAKAAAEVEAQRRAAEWRQCMAAENARLEEQRRIEAEKVAERERIASEKYAGMLKGLRSAAASLVDERIAFLRSRPTVPIASELAPSCRCQTWHLWRVSLSDPWRCFTCDPPRDREAVEVIRAEIPGRPVWDAATRRWN